MPAGAWRCAVYEHLFALSLSYHLQRRTGELSRAIERGVKSMTSFCRPGCSASARRILEFVLVLGILLWPLPVLFAAITFATVPAYAGFTIFTTNWRNALPPRDEPARQRVQRQPPSTA